MREKQHRASLEVLCGLFGVTRQAFYDAQIQERKTSVANMIVLGLVKELRAIMPLLGGRKLYSELAPRMAEHGIKMGRDQLFDLLRFHGLLIRRRRRMVRTTDSNHWLKKYPNLTKGLTVTESEQLWVGDITYIRTMQGFCYLSLLTDTYSRKIVGYSLWPTLESTGCIEALNMAVNSRKKKENFLIQHSDRGIQYCSATYVSILQNCGIDISMTQSGSPYENALAERVNGIIKNEFFPKRVYQNYKEAKKAIKQIVKIYNKRRPHSSLDFLTPESAQEQSGQFNKRWKTYRKARKTSQEQIID
jgi:transposase InsO family protein